MSDSSRIPDLTERRRALDPAHSFIVQAPAGSGKTELLIQRYLLLLAYVDHPEEIVAVTFTKKAAGEMRERVLQALTAARGGKVPGTDHEKLTLELAAAALQRDAMAGWRIAENPARLRIQTIDSLCASLTRQMPILSGFGSQPENIEDASELYLEAARATVELVESDDAVAQDIGRLLAHLDNNVGRIEELLADMLRRRDHWLRHVHGRERAELEAALGNARREALKRVRNCFHPLPSHLPSREREPETPLPTGGGGVGGEGVVAELIELARYAAANLVADGKISPIVACDRLAALPDVEESDAEAWLGIVELLLTGAEGDWRKKYDVRIGFPVGKTKTEKEASKRWKDRMLALIEQLHVDTALRAALHDLRFLPPAVYRDDQWEVLGAILRLLPRAVVQLKFVFQSRGQVDFTEVSQASLRALATDEGPTDLALALDYRIRHLLIDEFQDTSISQYELVARLTAGWEAGDSRTVFAVGDPMQSIYRFREAEVGLFLRARAAGIASVELQAIGLSANFRSQGGIVDWVNATFAQMMPRQEEVATGAVPYTASVATHAALESMAVGVHSFFNGDRAGEAARVVEIVAQARRDDAQARVAILVRNRGHLREIVPQLKDAGLRFRAIDIEELGHRPVVQDLLALTRALSHPADRLAWLALLRAPWCGLTLADLHALAGNDHVHTVWELMRDEAPAAVLSADGRARLQRVHAVLKTCLAHRGRGSLRERIAGAWFALGGPACVEDTTDLEDAEIYFEYLETHEEAGEIADPVAFEEGLAKLYALPDLQADERLQIMTIHKAKGLEFDIVIVPGLGRPARSDDPKLFLWTEQPRAAPSPNLSPARGGEEQSAPLSLDGRRAGGEGATDLLLAPIQETGADDDRIYAWLQKLEAEKESLEAERLLYVAATRAKRRLHLLGDTRFVPDKDGVFELKPPARNVLLGKLWPVVEPVYAAAATRLMESPSPLMGPADTAFAERSGVGGGAEARFPQTAGFTGNVSARQGRGEGVTSIDQSLRRLSSGWQLPQPPAPAVWTPPRDAARVQEEIEFSWVGETARHVGSVVHRWLQRIADDGLNGWDEKRVTALRGVFSEELAARGISENELDAAAARVAAALMHAVTDTRGRWLLGPHQDAWNERRITAIIDGERMNLVIDRMFCDADGKRWIVDYKTSGHEGADVEAFLDRERVRHQAQLDRYAAAVGGGQKPMLALYFPLLAGWREWRTT
jgi:ATP-dependent helicase/nuclease subunit A